MFSFPHRLYPIVDTLGHPRLSYVDLAQAILGAGVQFLQLRVKGQPTRCVVEIARVVQTAAVRAGARLIINDRAEIAKLVDAAGVHLGQDDLPAAAARSILGPHKIIGLSTHDLAQAEAAAREGVADYIGFGPVFPTCSKEHPDPVQGLDGLRQARRTVSLPMVAIGGITSETMSSVLAAGADAVAMISEIVRTDDITGRVRSLLQA